MIQSSTEANAFQVSIPPRKNGWLIFFHNVIDVLWANKKSRAGMIMIGVFVLVAIFGPLIAPYSVDNTSFVANLSFSPQHWLGTTQAGQDVLSELIVGTRLSLISAFAVGAIATTLSSVVGLTAGYIGGWTDEILSFVTNVFLVMPSLPLLIVIASYAPGKGIALTILIVSLTSWPWGARVLRSQAVTLRTRDFVTSAWLIGDGTGRILLREIFPNMLSLVMANFFGASSFGLLTTVGLQFLGLGDPNATSWGSMLYWANNSGALLNGQWGWILAPGMCIALLGMSFVLVNFGIDALSNPRLREDS